MTYNNTTLPTNLYPVGQGNVSSNPFVWEFQARDPTTNDLNWPIQKFWLNTTNNNIWFLKSFISSNGVVTANWVQFNSGVNPIETFTVDAFTPPGTNPVTPDTFGNVVITGFQVAAGTTTTALRTNSLALNTYAIEIQRSQAVASTTIGDNGICHFDSASFGVDANGFVTATGNLATSYVEDSGTAVASGGILNVVGGAGISTSGSGNTITIAATGADIAYTNVTHLMSPYTVLSSDYYLSVDCSGGTVTLNFPNAPTDKQIWIVKDRTGSASTNNITLTTPGGIVTIDGWTSYLIKGNFGSVNLLANATPTYEVF